MLQEKQKSDFYFEYDLKNARKHKSQLPEANHQKKAIKSLKKWFDARDYPSGTIVALPTGSGKTFTAVRFLSKHALSKGYKVLWLAHTHHLLEQAYFSFGPANTEVNKGFEVGWIQEPRNSLKIRVVSGTPHHYNVNQIKSSDDIVVATLQTIANAYKKLHPNFVDFLNSTGGKLVVVFDEAHHAPAPTYRNLILSLRENYPEMHVLGLTATPTYVDVKKRGWLKEIFPQTISYQAQVKDLMLEEILAEPYIEQSGTSFTPEFDEREFLKWREKGGKKIPEHIITQLASNKERNQFIANTYVNDMERYGKTIMFADRWHQCEQLSIYLKDKGIRADTMYTRTDNERNAIVLEKFRKNELDVVINIKMLTEGTDVPDVDTVFVTRQTTSPISITQMVGRALRGRKFGGTETANLVFFYDDWQKTINWAAWDTETWTARRIDDIIDVPEHPPLVNISIDAVRHLIDMMDRGEYINPGPFLTFLPTGWYQITTSEIGTEGSPEEVNSVVMVFENEENDYIQFIENLKEENLTDFDSDFIQLKDHMPRIKEWCDSFFPNAEENIGENMFKNIFDIAKHMAQNMKEPPRFIKFEERKKHNLDNIASKYIENDYGPRDVDKKLRKEYNREDRYWKVIYYQYDLFKSQYNACVDYLLSTEPPTQPPLTQEEIQVEKLKNGTISEKIMACEILGEMGGEENLHDETIAFILTVSQEDKNSDVRKAAQKALDIINSLDLSDEEKQNIKERDGFTCMCCGEDRKQYLQVDHVIPRWNEVDNSEINLQTLCKLCNITKNIEIIDFRETQSPLENPPNEIPYLYRIKQATKKQLNNIQWLKKFIKRSINFFYESRAVKNIKNENDTWDITLNNGNNPDWLIPHLNTLTEEIKSARETQGYTGPNIIQISEPKTDIESEESNEDDELTYLLKILQNDPDDITRRKAAYKLAKIKNSRIVPVLIKALDDKDPFAARAAARGLKLNPDSRSIVPLRNKFKSDDYDLRVECKDALVSIGKEAISDLLKALTRNDRKVREMAVEALGGIKEKSTLDKVIQALNDNESSVRWRAAKALGEFDEENAIKPLKDALKDSNGTVKKYAEASLETKANKIEKLYKEIEVKLTEYNPKIYKNRIASGDSYYSPKRHFMRTLIYDNPYRITFWAYIGNQNVDGIKRHKGDPDWATIYAHNDEELSKALEIIINGHKLFKAKIGEI